MIEVLPRSAGPVIGFKLSGKLHDDDYRKFIPAVDAVIAPHEKARILAWFHDFHGWDAAALWDDIKFSTTHCTKIDRIALIGEKAWESGWRPSASPSPWRTSVRSMRRRLKMRGSGSKRNNPTPQRIRVRSGAFCILPCLNQGHLPSDTTPVFMVPEATIRI